MANENGNQEHDEGAVVAEIARRHNVLLDRNDPMCMVPALVDLGFQRATQTCADQLTAATVNALRAEMGAVHREPGREVPSVVVPAIKVDVDTIVEVLREEFRKELARADSLAATLVANVDQAHSRPARVRWAAIGMMLAAGLLTVGIVIGRYLR